MNLLKCIIFIKTTCIYICFMYSLEKLLNIERYIKKKSPVMPPTKIQNYREPKRDNQPQGL